MMSLPDIASVEGLKSEEIVRNWKDHFNHPPCTNDFGSFRMAPDPMAIRDFLMPPFSSRNETTGMLYVNRKHPASEGVAIGYTWYPDRVRRRCMMDGFELETVAFAAVRSAAGLVRLTISNPGKELRKAEIAIKLAGRAIHTIEDWAGIGPEIGHMDGHPEKWMYDDRIGAMRFASSPGAFTVQGTHPGPDAVEGKTLLYNIALEAGDSWSLRFVVAFGEDQSKATDDYLRLMHEFDAECGKIHLDWEEKIRAAFISGNGIYSGFLPILHTRDKDLERLYYTAFAGSVLCCRRNNPMSQYGVAYSTLMPNYWTTSTNLWDMDLSADFWAIFEPDIVRKMVEKWLEIDLTKYLGTDYVTGKPLGYWYAVNDTGIVRLIDAYIRHNGNLSWLDANINGKSILDHAESHALRWHDLDIHGHGLADCGGIMQHCECVSTWLHESAAFNALWVAALRRVAAMRRLRGESGRAQALEADANALLKQVISLYVDGAGYWKCRQPDGSYNHVRNLYDILVAFEAIPDDLTEQMRHEMATRFLQEHKTDCWVRALSCWDDDVQRSFRADWQWSGGYTTFPAQAANVLCKSGMSDAAVAWMRRVALVARQGPIGQAHWVEGLVEPFQGGAYKCAPHWPYAADWTCIASGAFITMFIESFFGVRSTLNNGLQWNGLCESFDSDARLEHLRHREKQYRVTSQGIEEIS